MESLRSKSVAVVSDQLGREKRGTIYTLIMSVFRGLWKKPSRKVSREKKIQRYSRTTVQRVPSKMKQRISWTFSAFVQPDKDAVPNEAAYYFLDLFNCSENREYLNIFFGEIDYFSCALQFG